MTAPPRSDARPLSCGSVTILTCTAALVFVGCNAAGTQDPPVENGQTGSPGVPVPPDYDSPGFRPPEVPQPGSPGESPSFPERPLEPHTLTALHGEQLYVLEPGRGLLSFDVSKAAPRPLGELELDGVPLWIGVAGTELFIIRETLRKDSVDVVQELIRVDVSEPEKPRIAAQTELRGLLKVARVQAGRVVTLTAELEPVACSDTFGWNAGYQPTRNMRVTSYAHDGGEFDVAFDESIDGDGFIELPEGFVVTLGQLGPREHSMRFVAVKEDGAIDVSGVLEGGGGLYIVAPMQWSDGQLRFFASTTEGLRLFEVGLDDPEERRELLLGPGNGGGYHQGFERSVFSGNNLLIADDAAENALVGQVVHFSGDTEPTVVASFETPMNGFWSLDETTWVGLDDQEQAGQRLIRFELKEDGSVTQLDDLELPPWRLNTRGWSGPLAFDQAGNRALVPYSAGRDGPDRLGYIELGEVMTWNDGPEGEFGFDVAHLQNSVASGRFDWLGLTTGGVPALNSLTGLGVKKEPKLGARELNPNVRELARVGGKLAAVERRAESHWLTVAELEVDSQPRFDTDVDLEHRQARLSASDDQLLALSIHDSGDDCATRNDEDCESSEHRVLILDAKDVTLAASVALPEVAPVKTDGVRLSVEWLELVHTPAGAGLLQHRGYSCDSQTACEAEDIPFVWEEDLSGGAEMSGDDLEEDEPPEPGMVARGQIDEAWFYPLDLKQVELGKPRLLARQPAHDFIAAASFRQTTGFGLLQAERVTLHADTHGIASAKLSFLDFAAGTESKPVPKPLRGWPVATLTQDWAESPVTISIEPGGKSKQGDPGAAKSSKPSGKKSKRDSLHQLLNTEDGLRLTASLELGFGYRAHAWGREQGYVLSQSADWCAEDRYTELSVVRSGKQKLTRTSRLRLLGHGWEFAAQTDERVVLLQRSAGLQRWVLIDVTGEAEELSRRVLAADRHLLGPDWDSGPSAAIVAERAFVARGFAGVVELR